MWRSALLLCAAMVAGLTLGVLVPGAEAARALALPALAVQTVVSVGSLPPLAPGRARAGRRVSAWLEVRGTSPAPCGPGSAVR